MMGSASGRRRRRERDDLVDMTLLLLRMKIDCIPENATKYKEDERDEREDSLIQLRTIHITCA